jgi:hypothetical protein
MSTGKVSSSKQELINHNPPLITIKKTKVKHGDFYNDQDNIQITNIWRFNKEHFNSKMKIRKVNSVSIERKKHRFNLPRSSHEPNNYIYIFKESINIKLSRFFKLIKEVEKFEILQGDNMGRSDAIKKGDAMDMYFLGMKFANDSYLDSYPVTCRKVLSKFIELWNIPVDNVPGKNNPKLSYWIETLTKIERMIGEDNNMIEIMNLVKEEYNRNPFFVDSPKSIYKLIFTLVEQRTNAEQKRIEQEKNEKKEKMMKQVEEENKRLNELKEMQKMLREFRSKE